MATRNRTQLFMKYRDALRTVRAPKNYSTDSLSSASPSSSGQAIELVGTSLLNRDRSYVPLSTEDPGTSSKGVTRVGLPPPWVDVSEEIADHVQLARTKMMELAKAHAKALMPSFRDGREDQHMIETLTQEITDLIRKAEKKLQRLLTSGSSQDSNVRKNVQHSLATDLQNLSVELRKKQSSYLKRLQQQKEGPDGMDLEIGFDNGGSRGVENVDSMVFHDHTMTAMRRNDMLTEEREREINQVVKSVNELAQITKDLSMLVIDQGTIVDRIDYNIQNVSSTVQEGFKQLQKSERTQKQGVMVKCATVLVILCIIMLILLILKTIFF